MAEPVYIKISELPPTTDIQDTDNIVVVKDGITYRSESSELPGAPSTTVVPETTYGLTSSVGTSNNYAREDHAHGTPPEWDGDITDINLNGGTDIGTDLTDSDLILINDSTNKKSTISRIWDYIVNKLSTTRITLGKGVTEKSVEIFSSGTGQLNLEPFEGNINHHTLTENTELQIPDMTSWPAGTVVRMDLYIKVDAAGAYTFSINSGWQADGILGLPTPSADPDAIDRYVIDLHKDLNITSIGQAQQDLT